MSRTQVYTWFTRFKNGCDDLNDDPRPGRSEASNRAKLVGKVREIIAIDTNLRVRMLTEELNSSYCTIYTKLARDLGKRKVCARIVPHKLNEDQKIARVEHCKDIISTAENDPHFLDSIIADPYSPDLAPCDYFLFPKLKTAIKGAFYDDVPTIQAAVTQVLNHIPKTEFKLEW